MPIGQWLSMSNEKLFGCVRQHVRRCRHRHGQWRHRHRRRRRRRWRHLGQHGQHLWRRSPSPRAAASPRRSSCDVGVGGAREQRRHHCQRISSQRRPSEGQLRTPTNRCSACNTASSAYVDVDRRRDQTELRDSHTRCILLARNVRVTIVFEGEGHFLRSRGKSLCS